MIHRVDRFAPRTRVDLCAESLGVETAIRS